VAANLDSIVAGVIEDSGSKALKTQVSVSGVSINLKAGKAGIAGLTINNPDGYSSAKLFNLEGIAVDLDLSSLNEDVLVIESIRIQNPRISFEVDENGENNMQTLLNNIESGASEGGDEAQGEALKMIINEFEFSGGQVNASSKLKPGEDVDLKLKTIKLSNIGKAQGGVTADVVAQEITSELVGAVIGAAAKAGISKSIEKKTKSFLDKLKGKDKDGG
jgi:uncharacterized protein involved in outer membrane biogenesis